MHPPALLLALIAALVLSQPAAADDPASEPPPSNAEDPAPAAAPPAEPPPAPVSPAAAEAPPAPAPPPEPIEGIEGGVIGGVIGGPLYATDGTKVVHWSEVQVKKRVTPKYPDEARTLGIEGGCVVRFSLDVKGVPTRVEPTNCPDIFKASAVEAAMKWRFYPYKVDGVPHEAQFVLKINYRLK